MPFATPDSPCQIRHLDFISQFTSDIRVIKEGASNAAADALSRLEVDVLNTVPDSTSQLDFSSMARAQQDRLDLFNSFLLQLRAVPVQTSHTTLLCDMSTGIPRPYVPQPFRRAVIDALHSLSHPDIRAMQ